jgi:hypothetical protein
MIKPLTCPVIGVDEVPMSTMGSFARHSLPTDPNLTGVVHTPNDVVTIPLPTLEQILPQVLDQVRTMINITASTVKQFCEFIYI